ncbi:hypothetical protein APHAL10511_000696 [Amanita phalloides]|nr:hypothetical protein APHAL10511_000696 [Amanita phalloides]
MPSLRESYAPPIAAEGWNYVRYLGPLHHARTRPLYLSVRQAELVVTANREPTKLWSIDRLGPCGEDMNRHACSLKREGTQTYVSYNLPISGDKGEVVLGPQTRFDISRVNRMQKPCHIIVYQEPSVPDAECCEEGSESIETDEPQSANDDDVPMDVDTETEAPEEARKVEKPPPVEWCLGVSEDFKVILKAFPPTSEYPEELVGQRPVWEFTSRAEAINQDYPTPVVAPPAWDPVAARNPLRRDFSLHPRRFEIYNREYWPELAFAENTSDEVYVTST